MSIIAMSRMGFRVNNIHLICLIAISVQMFACSQQGAQPSTEVKESLVTVNYTTSKARNETHEEQEGPVPRIIAMTVDAIGVFCNTLLILAILIDPLNVLRKGAWFTILNLSIADLTAGLSNCLDIGLQAHFNAPNPIVLRTFRFFWLFGVGGSFLLLVLLTAETYVIVKYPIRSRTMLLATKFSFLCAGAWILAFLLGISNIQYIIFDTSFEQSMKIYIAQIAVLELAVLAQVLLKVLIIREIIKSKHNIEASGEHRNNRNRKIAKTIVILNVILIVTAFPYFVAKQIEYLYKLDVIGGNQLWRLFSNYYEPVAVLNFALNPILYSLRLPDYRRSLLALLCQSRNRRELPSSLASVTASSFREAEEESTRL